MVNGGGGGGGGVGSDGGWFDSGGLGGSFIGNWWQRRFSILSGTTASVKLHHPVARVDKICHL
jgi:hypothetical protein